MRLSGYLQNKVCDILQDSFSFLIFLQEPEEFIFLFGGDIQELGEL